VSSNNGDVPSPCARKIVAIATNPSASNVVRPSGTCCAPANTASASPAAIAATTLTTAKCEFADPNVGSANSHFAVVSGHSHPSPPRVRRLHPVLPPP